jgi:hypothetical protein
MIRDVSAKSVERPVGRNRLGAGIRCCPNNEAVFQPAFRADRLRSYGKGGDQPYSQQKLIHHVSPLMS